MSQQDIPMDFNQGMSDDDRRQMEEDLKQLGQDFCPSAASVVEMMQADGNGPHVTNMGGGVFIDESYSVEAMMANMSSMSSSNNNVEMTQYVVQQQPEDNMPYYDQTGEVSVGVGAQKEAILLGLGLPKLSSRQHDDLSRAKRYAMEQSIKHVLLKQTVAHQQQQQKNAMYSQALSLMARVYVGSVSFELREDTIKNAFSPFGPIKSVNMSFDPATGHHKGFAFIEYELPEAASLAQEQMNGVLMGGRNVKVGRPSNMPQAQPIIEMIMSDAKKFNRIYVASIHMDLTENDIKSVFEAFGRVISIDLPKNPFNTKHRGYAYIEYETDKSALDAVASMNLFDLGGQYLRVGRAVTPPQALQFMTPSANSTLPTAAAVAAAAVTAKIQALDATVTGAYGGGGSGLSSAPKVIVAGQPLSNTVAGSTGSIFSVPPPGVAIPQAPSMIVVTPQLYSVPPSAAAPNGSASNSPGGIGPSMGGNNSPNVAPVPVPPPFGVVPQTKIQPVAQQQASQLTEAKKAVSLIQQQMQGSETAQRLLQNATLTEQQKKLIEMDAGQTLAQQEDLKIKGNEARNILMHKLMRRIESCVLVLRNMVGPADVDQSLQEEVEEECSNYGKVDHCIIYQEKQGEHEDAPIIVKIFVKYSLPQEAETAKNKFDGRYFAGRRIKAELYDQALFEHNDLSG